MSNTNTDTKMNDIIKYAPSIHTYLACDNPAYLTESSLGVFLNDIFPDKVWIHDKQLKESGTRFRPDYRCDELKLIVEFDGYHHFTNPNRIIADEIKDRVFTSMGYSVIRIPYFIQLDVGTVEYFFNVKWNPSKGVIYNFPHGFIIKTAKTPAEFCTLGVEKWRKWVEILLRDNEQYFGEWSYRRMMWYQVIVLDRDPKVVCPLMDSELISAIYKWGYPK